MCDTDKPEVFSADTEVFAFDTDLFVDFWS